MKPSISHWQTGGFVFVSLLGTLLHFFFEWTGGSIYAALISAVNESIWEHTKLLYYPLLVFAQAEYRAWGIKIPAFWCIKLNGTILGLGLIPALYYSYTEILGISADWFNITIFFLAAAAVLWTETRLFQEKRACRLPPAAALVLLLIPIPVFSLLTFSPTQIPFFEVSPHGNLQFPDAHEKCRMSPALFSVQTGLHLL